MAVEDMNSDPPHDYSQMILVAIEELDEEEGSTASAISKHVLSNNPADADAHDTLLSTTLQSLTRSGHLTCLNGKYLKPDPNSPPPAKRGRGRPPKPKTPLPPGAVAVAVPTGSPRPRGRPPKPRDPNAPSPPPKVSSGRPRGRPRKYPAAAPKAPAAVSGVKRGRGRPPKNKP